MIIIPVTAYTIRIIILIIMEKVILPDIHSSCLFPKYSIICLVRIPHSILNNCRIRFIRGIWGYIGYSEEFEYDFFIILF